MLFPISVINPLFYDVEKWPHILQKSCYVNTARFLKYAWPIFNIMKQRIKSSSYSFFFFLIYWFSFLYSLKICFKFMFKTRNLNIPAYHIEGGLLHSSGVFEIYYGTFGEKLLFFLRNLPPKIHFLSRSGPDSNG